jgi:hypothetical protein
MTAYGPEGDPGRMPPEFAVGSRLVVAVGTARPGVAAGRFRVGVAAGTGEEGTGVGEDRRMGVVKGLGARSKESEQPVRNRMAKPAAKKTRMCFIITLLRWYLILTLCAYRGIWKVKTMGAGFSLHGNVFGG